VFRRGAGENVCGLQLSDNVNQGHVTTAAGLGTTNKPDAQEDGLAQHPKEVTFAGGKECALESFNKDSRVELNAAVRNADNDKSNAKEDEALTTEEEDEGGETPRQPVSLCIGTNVCSWFRNCEAYVNTPAVEVEKLQQEWTIKYGAESKRIKQGWEADGEWYNGKVINVRKNKYHVKVYSCTFQTPDRNVVDLTHKETKNMLKAYLQVHAYRRQQKIEDLLNQTKPEEEMGGGEQSALEKCDATEDADADGNDEGPQSSVHQDDGNDEDPQSCVHQDETDEQTMKVPHPSPQCPYLCLK
jgi:hypothetical protein